MASHPHNPHKPLEPADFLGLWVNAQPIVRSFIFGTVRNLHDAEDILQEVARSAFVSFESYDPARPFNGWVMTLARRRVVDHFRGASPDTIAFDESTLAALSEAHASLHDVAHARRVALDDCMRQIHERGRLALELRYAQDRAVKDIATEMKTSPHAISVLLYKVKASLADCIDRKVADQEGER